MLRGSPWFAVLLAAAGCTNKLGVEVELRAPVAPDPFAGVETVRMRALVLGEVVTLGEDRWDQGPIELPAIVDPEVERFVVEGLASDGRVLSSGASAPLDLLNAPPDDRLAISFTRIGALSLLSTTVSARNGGRAVELSDRRVLFAGGTDDSGAPIELTELADRQTISSGPLSGGRTGAYAVEVLPNGRVVIAGGGDPRIASLDPDANSSRFSTAQPLPRTHAAIAAVSNTLLIVAGGDEGEGVSDELLRYNADALEPSTPGRLFDARAESTAVVVSGDRVLMLGGRSGRGDDSAKRDAPVFDPSRGGAALRAIDLGRPLIAPIARVTAAGSAIVAGGRDQNGAPQSVISAVVVQSERAQAFGDTSTVAVLPSPVDRGSLLDLDDGTLLFLPLEGEERMQHIALLPGSVAAVAPLEGVPGPWIGGRISDGTILLRSAAGRLAIFNSGPSAVLGAFDPGLPIIPLRPRAWARISGGVEGVLLPGLPSGIAFAPAELAVLGNTELADFELSFTLELDPLSQASIAFGLRAGAFDHLSMLGNLALVGRAQPVGIAASLACASSETPPLAGTGTHRLRVARKNGQVRADLDGDGADDLFCSTPDAASGRVALGVITGRARFTDLKVRSSF